MSNNTIPESELQKIKSLFKTTDKDLPKKKEIIPHRVKVFGSWLVTDKGKTLWTSKRNAVLAVQNTLRCGLYEGTLDTSLLPEDALEKSVYLPQPYLDVSRLRVLLEKNGYIEYIPVFETQ